MGIWMCRVSTDYSVVDGLVFGRSAMAMEMELKRNPAKNAKFNREWYPVNFLHVSVPLSHCNRETAVVAMI